MAELDPDAAAALGEALANALGSELSRPIACRDVSAEHREWDFEALDSVTAEVVRLVSHVRCVPERMMKAMAEVTDDIWAVLQEELAALGVRDCIVSFGSRDLPKSKRERKTLARLVARRIHEHVTRGTPLLADELEWVSRGRHPFEDQITRHFYSLNVSLIALGPARVFSASDDRLVSFVPPLREMVLPTIARKQSAHGDLAGDLTLVVELREGSPSTEELEELRSVLRADKPQFRSVYLGVRAGGREYELARVY